MTREVKNGKVALKVDSVGEWITMSGKLFQVHTALKRTLKDTRVDSYTWMIRSDSLSKKGT